MTIAFSHHIQQHLANGVTTEFAFSYKILNERDINVYRTYLGELFQDGVGIHYEVTGVGEDEGVTVVFDTAPASGTYVTIALTGVEITQLVDYIANDSFKAETHEQALDKLTLICAQLNGLLARTPKFPVGLYEFDYPVLEQLPEPQALSLLGMDAGGNWKFHDLTYNISTVDPDNIEFLQSGTGAVPRTMLKKAQESVSVTDFGATGDGSTDDTAAIQAALDAADGRVVRAPVGTYMVDSVSLPSNSTLVGEGDLTVFKARSADINVLATSDSEARSNIVIRDLKIDGGGQTSDVNTGLDGAKGIYLTRVTNALVDNVTIDKCGIVSASDPTTDSGIGGFGIIVNSRNGASTDIRISNCRISNIAGGGSTTGDGVYIAGYETGPATTKMDVVVSDCWVSTCGRHCYTVAGGSGLSVPSGVRFVNCYAEKSGLSGIDLEEGQDTLISGCKFIDCGNDQTYYDPVTEYGATMRLICGVATGLDSDNASIVDCLFDKCYYGLTEGATEGLLVSNCTFRNSTVADIAKGLASSSASFTLSGCKLMSDLNALNYHLASAGGNFRALGCEFSGTVQSSAMKDGAFEACVFRKGFEVTGGSSGFARVKFSGCSFSDWAGPGIKCDGTNYAATDVVVDGCVFYGTGNLTNGIQLDSNSAVRWMITNNAFVGLSNAGISQGAAASRKLFSAIGNSFVSCADGIEVTQGLKECTISDNVFSGITGWCISIASISSGNNLIGTTIANNVFGDDCANGLQISVSTGAWDYCIVVGNNAHYATGTKWSLSAGNANGVTANNITT